MFFKLTKYQLLGLISEHTHITSFLRNFINDAHKKRGGGSHNFGQIFRWLRLALGEGYFSDHLDVHVSKKEICLFIIHQVRFIFFGF